ncbi:MAG: aminotransferase class V-fold PLP-dependent enzyme [Clostridiales bacterium]|nr:aminotransferase class V-fold PLP-dependent enzyme [Clostridiales bacterium]
MIYLDNSATTYPKPESVHDAVREALVRYGANSGRSGYDMAMETAGKIYESREKAAEMFGAESPEHVAFTLNCTHAVNLALKGLLRCGDHVVTSNLEHNAVMRPLEALAQRGYITYSTAAYHPDAEEVIRNFRAKINSRSRGKVWLHASHVLGTAIPIIQLAELSRRYGLYLVVDGAQSAGIAPIDMQWGIDALCLPGHKGLYGPMGTGLLITPRGEEMQTVIEGGTGSASSSLEQPEFMPDRLESGTENTAGIIGLGAGLDFVSRTGVKAIRDHEYALASQLYRGLKSTDGVKLYTPEPAYPASMPILSFNYRDLASEETAARLSDRGVAVRAGFHCAYAAHLVFGTRERGTVRLSPSVFTTEKDADAFLSIMKNL